MTAANYTLLGVIVAWSFVLAYFILRRLFRCPHQWELVDKTQLPSKIEELCKHWKPDTMTMKELLEVSKINATIVIRCNKCGECKIMKMSNAD